MGHMDHTNIIVITAIVFLEHVPSVVEELNGELFVLF